MVGNIYECMYKLHVSISNDQIVFDECILGLLECYDIEWFMNFVNHILIDQLLDKYRVIVSLYRYFRYNAKLKKTIMYYIEFLLEYVKNNHPDTYLVTKCIKYNDMDLFRILLLYINNQLLLYCLAMYTDNRHDMLKVLIKDSHTVDINREMDPAHESTYTSNDLRPFTYKDIVEDSIGFSPKHRLTAIYYCNNIDNFEWFLKNGAIVKPKLLLNTIYRRGIVYITRKLNIHVFHMINYILSIYEYDIGVNVPNDITYSVLASQVSLEDDSVLSNNLLSIINMYKNLNILPILDQHRSIVHMYIKQSSSIWMSHALL